MAYDVLKIDFGIETEDRRQGTFLAEMSGRIQPLRFATEVKFGDFTNRVTENGYRIAFSSDFPELVPRGLADAARVALVTASVTATCSSQTIQLSSIGVQCLREDGALIDHQPIGAYFVGAEPTGWGAIGQHWPQRTWTPVGYQDGLNSSGTHVVEAHLNDFSLSAAQGKIDALDQMYLNTYQRIERAALQFRDTRPIRRR